MHENSPGQTRRFCSRIHRQNNEKKNDIFFPCQTFEDKKNSPFFATRQVLSFEEWDPSSLNHGFKKNDPSSDPYKSTTKHHFQAGGNAENVALW